MKVLPVIAVLSLPTLESFVHVSWKMAPPKAPFTVTWFCLKVHLSILAIAPAVIIIAPARCPRPFWKSVLVTVVLCTWSREESAETSQKLPVARTTGLVPEGDVNVFV